MNQITNIIAATGTEAAVTTSFKVDTSKGGHDSTVSSQWFARPPDQRHLSLDDLRAAVTKRSAANIQEVIDVDHIRVDADRANADILKVGYSVHGDVLETQPTHWSFGQLAGLAKAPAGYLRSLPASIAAINLGYGLRSVRDENVKLYHNRDDGTLYAATGADYGRIFDSEVVEAVQRVAGNGTGDTRWKVPGLLDWSKGTYNPFVDVTTQTTTLYASDRDVFIFLVDDTHPISIGKLPNGDDDLVFRGFYVYNSEVGSKALGASFFLLRGVCQNRNLWGVEDQHTLKIRHSKFAPRRFAAEVGPALLSYSEQSVAPIQQGIANAKAAVVAKTDDDRRDFLTKRDFSAKQADDIIATVLREEGRPPESVWDFVQGITAVARKIEHTDNRVSLERVAGKLLQKAAA